MIKTSMVVLAVAGTAAGVAVTRGVDADGSEAPATDERAPDRDASVGAEQAKPLVADAAGVGASAGQRSDEAAEGGDELRGKWAARKTAIRSVLGESGAEPGVAPQQHKLGYAKLIRACVKDLQDVPATLSVKLTEIGAPDVGTIVAAAEVISTSVDNPAVTECAEQSMYAYVGDAPPTAYERSYRFTVVLPGKKFTPEILDMMFAQNMANRFRPVRRCESAGVKGHIELELEIGDDGKTKSVAVAESSVDASIGECITKDAVEWQFPPMLAGKERRYRYTLPVQAPKVRRK